MTTTATRKSATPPTPRTVRPAKIDALPLLATVTLEYQGEPSEQAVFLGIEGTGDDRVARFASLDDEGQVMQWHAYRHRNRWAYGMSAQRVMLASIDHVVRAG